MNIKKITCLIFLSIITFNIFSQEVLMMNPEGAIYKEENGLLIKIDNGIEGTLLDLVDYSELKKDISENGTIEKDVPVYQINFEEKEAYVKHSDIYMGGGTMCSFVLTEDAVIYTSSKLSLFTNKFLKKGTILFADWDEISNFEENKNKLTSITYWDNELNCIKHCGVLARKISNGKDLEAYKYLSKILENYDKDMKISYAELALETAVSPKVKEIAQKYIDRFDPNHELSSHENDNLSIHGFNYSLNFELNGYNTKVYKSPSFDEMIYEVQKGDIVNITEFVTVKESNKTFLKVNVNNIDGYIYISSNPFENNNFTWQEYYEEDGIQMPILQLEGLYGVYDGVTIKEFPSESSKDLHTISHEEGGYYYKSLCITADYKWVKMRINNYTGWVPADSLYVDRGGPVIYTPENLVYFNLIGSHEI